MNEHDSLMNAAEEFKRFAKENPFEIKTAKELESTPENLKMAAIGHGRQSVARQLLTFAGLINGLGKYADDDENEFEE